MDALTELRVDKHNARLEYNAGHITAADYIAITSRIDHFIILESHVTSSGDLMNKYL